MCELPSVSEVTHPVARKRHRCCECTRLMDIGERHQLCWGIWDGSHYKFRTCLSCACIRDWLSDEIRAERLYGDDDCGVEFGGLEAACILAYEEWCKENGIQMEENS